MKALLILLALAQGAAFTSQDSGSHRVIEVRPESNPDGKLLTMREATIERHVYPRPDAKTRALVPQEAKRTPSRFGVKENVGVYMLNGSDTLWIARDSADIHYGVSVSRNEFGINGGLFPSPDDSKLAFYRKNESAVSTFPLLDIRKGNGKLRAIKYPMNGESSEIIDLLVYDSSDNSLITLEVNDFTAERYICAVSWLSEERITAQILSRDQHDMNLALFDAESGKRISTILSEHNDIWVEPYDSQITLNDKLFLYSSDNRDGYKNIYLVDTKGGIKRVTATDADCEFIAWKAPYLYYYSAEESPAECHAYRVKLNLASSAAKSRVGKPAKLTSGRGTHTVRVMDDCIIDYYSSFSVPGTCTKRSLNGKPLETIYTLDDPLTDYAMPEIEFGSIPSADGLYENHYRLLKPVGFDSSKKYPLIVYVYGGPHSQMVTDSWLGNIRMWEALIAQRGYIVYVQDNRGTSNHGAGYEKAINRQCGQAEMQDQMAGIERLLKEPWVDAERVGVHGWSYGGFMTISLALNYPDTFKAAVAGGPVIDWKWYEVMYGERYMDTVETNPEGFAKSSLIGKADALKGKLLICQGAVDNTVVWEHSLSFLQDCIEAGKQVDYFPFPIAEHNMYGMERVYLYQKISDWFDMNL